MFQDCQRARASSRRRKILWDGLKNEYLGGFWTDFAKSNAIFSLGKVGSFHLLRSRSQKVSFKVKIESEDGQDVWKNLKKYQPSGEGGAR